MASLSCVFVIFCAAVFTHAEPCRDYTSICHKLVRYCDDAVWEGWMKEQCALTCGHCGEKPERTTMMPQTAIPTTSEEVDTTPAKVVTTEETITGNCGVPQIKGNRIVGGKDAVPGSWPWQILMLYNGIPGCGGSIISADWIVSAAHCTYGLENYPNDFIIRTGEHDRSVLEGHEREYDVEKIIRHPNYDPYKLNYDIVLLKLKTPIMFDKYRSPVCLPSHAAKVGDKCMITGWGKMHHKKQMVNILQEGVLPVVTREKCHNLNMKNINIPVTEAMVCGGSGGSNILSGCHGDSGGPYVCKDGGYRWVLQGAVSHGSPRCNSTETYTAFANVFYFKSWIQETMRKQ